ncbi:MAG: LicD family protein [Eubacterium sp.]|nr:LicD family protein [Eubacterium sp.]
MKFSLSTVEAFKLLRSRDTIELTDDQLIDLQRTLYDILYDIVRFCDRYKIRYELGGGSVLGAVRHGGIIPWDDDIDINMPRRDYEKFRRLFPRKMGEKYWIHTPEKTNNLALLFSRVRLKGTSVKTREDYYTDECGAFIDIFIIENTFDNPVLRKIHGYGSLALGLLLSCRKFWRDRKMMVKLVKSNKRRIDGMTKIKCAFIIKILLGLPLAILPINFWTRLANNWNRMCRNDKSKYVTTPCGRKHFFGELYKREDLVSTVPMQFGDIEAQIPRAYDYYLTRLYGDYKQIPKDAEQEKHLVYEPFIL